MEPSRTARGDNPRRHRKLFSTIASLLGEGRLIHFGTESGFYIGASGGQKQGCKRLLGAGQWGSPWRLQVMAADVETIKELAEPCPRAEKIWSRYPMGPLGLRLGLKVDWLDQVEPHPRRVTFVVPFDAWVREMLSRTGPLLCLAWSRQCDPKVAESIPELCHTLNLEQTVLDLGMVYPTLLSDGFIGHAELERALGERILLSSDQATPLRFTRFRPEARLIVVEGDTERTRRRLKMLRESYSVVERLLLLVSEETARTCFADDPAVQVLQPERAEAQVQEVLDSFGEEVSAPVVLIEGVSREHPEGARLMERLEETAEQFINTENPGYAGHRGLA